MPGNRETIEMRLKLARARQFDRDTNRAARSVDNLGDQAAQAARKFARLNAASSKTRVSIGPFSTSMRGAALAVGGFIMTAKTAIPAALSLAEAVGTTGLAAGGVGLAGFTALAQGALVTKLGLTDVTAALGGNTAALKRMAPEAQNLFYNLSKAQDRLKTTSNRALFPGLNKGALAAMRNLPVANRIVGSTAGAIGGLGASAGKMIGSKAWGKDLATVGKTNVHVITDLGKAGLHLANAARSIVVEAGPLTKWLADNVREGSKLVDVWIQNQRASGGLTRFFKRAKTDMRLMFDIGRHATGGILNLFGNRDVDGTTTLRNLDQLMAKFDQWTRTIAGKPLGPELEKVLAQGLGAAASFLGSHIGMAGRTAAGAFVQSFKSADIWGKGAIALWVASKLGLGKGIAGLLTRGLRGGAGGLVGKATSKAMPIPVYVVNEGWGGKGGPKGGPLKTIAKTATKGAPFVADAALSGGGLAASYLIAAGIPAYLAYKYATRPPARVAERTRRQAAQAAGGATRNVYLDAQGFPVSHPVAGGSMIPKGGTTPVIETHITFNVDGKKLYDTTVRQQGKRQARRRARVLTPAVIAHGTG